MEELVKGDFIEDINEDLGENSEWTTIEYLTIEVIRTLIKSHPDDLHLFVLEKVLNPTQDENENKVWQRVLKHLQDNVDNEVWKRALETKEID